ncbi:energy transducer TonB [Algibacter sp. R77976]|uniref:energy transducer TonB n=1 Tax=Algibacter sp. R77976 TaxID=3093873 RepID=UPI0037C8C462
MKKYYSIAIPKPCHEDWNKMSQREKGKFCSSCSKTVIDFTKMKTNDIQDYIHQNKDNRICGHFKQTQLDSINLHIPSQVLEKRQSFQKTFLLVLLIVMGTTLMNCTNKNGNKQKIDSIEVIDTLNNKINILGGLPQISEIDSIYNKTCKTTPKEKGYIDIETEGELIIETVGDIEILEQPPISIDSINILKHPKDDEELEVMGDIISEEELNHEIVLGMISVDTPPEFQNTPQKLSTQEKKDYFSKQISKIISDNFNTSVCLDLKGKQRINVQFKINEDGKTFDIRARAPNEKLEDEAIRVIKLFPQFKPAEQRGKPVKMVYTLPIIFQVEE